MKYLILIFIISSMLVTGCQKADSEEMESSTTNVTETTDNTAVFAGGCYWCMDAAFEKLDGLEDVISGYAVGSLEDKFPRSVIPKLQLLSPHTKLTEASLKPR